jgi:hypothetical protein
MFVPVIASISIMLSLNLGAKSAPSYRNNDVSSGSLVIEPKSKVLTGDIQPGDSIQNYRLLERTALLGICGHDSEEQQASSSEVVLRSQALQKKEVEQRQLLDSKALPSSNTCEPRLEGPSLEYQCFMDNIELIYVNQNYRLRKVSCHDAPYTLIFFRTQCRNSKVDHMVKYGEQRAYRPRTTEQKFRIHLF